MWRSAPRAQTLRWTSQGDALTLDPNGQNEGPTNAMVGNIYERLVNRDYNLALQPELAVSWEPIGDGSTWEFKLREGVTFHDGSAFTASDVVFSIGRAQAETSDFKEQVASITEVIAVDDLTVHIVTAGPNPILPNELTSIFIMDEQWAETHDALEPQNYAAGDENYAVRNANGTGPFILESRAQDELTVLVANDNWWGADSFPTNIERIEYRPISNAATRVAALLSGEVDFVLDPPLQDIARIEATEGLKVLSTAQNRTIFFGMDQGVETLRNSEVDGNPFADVRVREAINIAIDREAIRQIVMEDLSVPAGIIATPFVNGSTPELNTPQAADIDAAKALLAEAGYPDGFTVQLDCPNDRYINDAAICQAAVSMLAGIGITVNLDAIPKAQHFPKIQNRETDFYLLGWGVPTLDSHYVFSYLLAADGSWNATGYDNPRVNELTEAMVTQTDLDARNAMINEVWEIAKADTVYVPIHHQTLAWAMSEDLELPIAGNDTPYFRFAVMAE